MKEKKLYAVEVTVTEVHKRKFLVKASSRLDAKKVVEKDLDSGSSYVYDKTTDYTDDQKISTRILAEVNEQSKSLVGVSTGTLSYVMDEPDLEIVSL